MGSGNEAEREGVKRPPGCCGRSLSLFVASFAGAVDSPQWAGHRWPAVFGLACSQHREEASHGHPDIILGPKGGPSGVLSTEQDEDDGG